MVGNMVEGVPRHLQHLEGLTHHRHAVTLGHYMVEVTGGATGGAPGIAARFFLQDLYRTRVVKMMMRYQDAR